MEKLSKPELFEKKVGRFTHVNNGLVGIGREPKEKITVVFDPEKESKFKGLVEQDIAHEVKFALDRENDQKLFSVVYMWDDANLEEISEALTRDIEGENLRIMDFDGSNGRPMEESGEG